MQGTLVLGCNVRQEWHGLLTLIGASAIAEKHNMVYGYVRVSTDKQTVANQHFEIERFCQAEGITIDKWIEETVSGTYNPDKRRLGTLLGTVHSGDLIICSELSRLGRRLFMVMTVLGAMLDRNVRVWTVKDRFRLGDGIESKVLAFAFGLSAEIERNLIAQRTREALALRRAQGVRLGRPKGNAARHRLDTYKEEISEMLAQGISKLAIARRLNVAPGTLYAHLKREAAKAEGEAATQ